MVCSQETLLTTAYVFYHSLTDPRKENTVVHTGHFVAHKKSGKGGLISTSEAHRGSGRPIIEGHRTLERLPYIYHNNYLFTTFFLPDTGVSTHQEFIKTRFKEIEQDARIRHDRDAKLI